MTQATSPSEKLSADIVDRMVKAGLIRADKRNELITKIAAGHMQSADWKLEIELGHAKSAAETKAKNDMMRR